MPAPLWQAPHVVWGQEGLLEGVGVGAETFSFLFLRGLLERVTRAAVAEYPEMG